MTSATEDNHNDAVAGDSPLALLPIDLLALVFEYLPAETVVLNCSRVSRHWHAAAKACTFSFNINRGEWLLWRTKFWQHGNATQLHNVVDTVRHAWPHALPLLCFIPHEFIFEVDDRHPWAAWRQLLTRPGLRDVVAFRRRMGGVRRFLIDPERRERYQALEAQHDSADALPPPPSAPQTPGTLGTSDVGKPVTSRLERMRAALESGRNNGSSWAKADVARDWARAVERRKRLGVREWSMDLERLFSALPALEGLEYLAVKTPALPLPALPRLSTLSHLSITVARGLDDLEAIGWCERLETFMLSIVSCEGSAAAPASFPRLSLEPLAKCTRLEQLVLSNVRLTGPDALRPLSQCKKLRVFNYTEPDSGAADTAFALDLSPLVEDAAWGELYIMRVHAHLVDLTPLVGNHRLSKLEVRAERLEGVDAIAQCHGLSWACLCVNTLGNEDVQRLRGARLSHLILRAPLVNELSTLGELPLLRVLKLETRASPDDILVDPDFAGNVHVTRLVD